MEIALTREVHLLKYEAFQTSNSFAENNRPIALKSAGFASCYRLASFCAAHRPRLCPKVLTGISLDAQSFGALTEGIHTCPQTSQTATFCDSPQP